MNSGLLNDTGQCNEKTKIPKQRKTGTTTTTYEGVKKEEQGTDERGSNGTKVKGNYCYVEISTSRMVSKPHPPLPCQKKFYV